MLLRLTLGCQQSGALSLESLPHCHLRAHEAERH
ncbi:hypothetical protein EMIT0158MI4_40383 [Burkholderia ambifaria]